MDHKLGEGALTGAAVDLLAVGLTSENWKASEALVELDSALGGKLISTLEAEGFDAKAGTSRVVHTLGAVAPARIFVFGLGASAEVEAQGYRDFGFAAAAATIKAKGKRLGILATSEQASQVALGVEGGAYRFTRHKSEAEPSTLTECVWCNAGAHAKSAVDEAHALAAAVARARDLVNEPAGHCDPNTLLAQAQELAQLHGLELRVLEREELEAEGYGCLLGVGRDHTAEGVAQEGAHGPAVGAAADLFVIEEHDDLGRGRRPARRHGDPGARAGGSGWSGGAGGDRSRARDDRAASFYATALAIDPGVVRLYDGLTTELFIAIDPAAEEASP